MRTWKLLYEIPMFVNTSLMHGSPLPLKTSKGNTYTCGDSSGDSFISGMILLVEILQYFWKLLFEIPMFVNTPLMHGSPLLFKTFKGNTYTRGYFYGESFLSGKLLLVEILQYFCKLFYEIPMCGILPSCMDLL